ncbi:MAG: 4Fe-4S binding protein [Bacteroidales bacterium]|nr:4Fe-4S binding protein [Bacteroidales bacterium]
MKREIIKIDEDKCNGCGLCIPGCPEGALQIIDGKARLVSDLMCDGLGACIGDCPEGAIEIETREAEPYNETAVIKEIIKHGFNTVVAHLKHLREHGETAFLEEAIAFLEQQDNLGYTVVEVKQKVHEKDESNACSGGCPGSAPVVFDIDTDAVNKAAEGTSAESTADQPSTLRQWPVQMHLINPNASYFKNADVLLAADCTAFSMGNFHSKFLKGKSLAIACPKLDSGTEVYVQKLTSMIDEAQINTLHVMVMEVPCCSSLLQMAKMAIENADRKIPLKKTLVGIRGEIISEEWV